MRRTVGFLDCFFVGSFVNLFVGGTEGFFEGFFDGRDDDFFVGRKVGFFDGFVVGRVDNRLEGRDDGFFVVLRDGFREGLGHKSKILYRVANKSRVTLKLV